MTLKDGIAEAKVMEVKMAKEEIKFEDKLNSLEKKWLMNLKKET